MPSPTLISLALFSPMEKLFLRLLAFVFAFNLSTKATFGLTLQDFRDVIYRPRNLPGTDTSNVSPETKIIDVVDSLIRLLLFASGSIAVIMLIYGGIRFITSFGNQEARDKAVTIIRWAIIGLLVVILSFAIVTNVINLLFEATT